MRATSGLGGALVPPRPAWRRGGEGGYSSHQLLQASRLLAGAAGLLAHMVAIGRDKQMDTYLNRIALPPSFQAAQPRGLAMRLRFV